MNASKTASHDLWPDGLVQLEDLISLPAAAGKIKEWTRGPTNPSTLWRWTRDGRCGVLLPHVRVGRTVYTTEDALRWFLSQSTVLAAGAPPQQPPALTSNADITALAEQEGL